MLMMLAPLLLVGETQGSFSNKGPHMLMMLALLLLA